MDGLRDAARYSLILKGMWPLYCIILGHSKTSYPALGIHTVTILQKSHCL